MKTTTLLLITLTLALCSISFVTPKLKPCHQNSADSFSLSNGKKVFANNCAGCHGASGQGAYGPNLCDKYWIHGSHYHGIVHVIKHGVSKKGMTAFRHSLSHAQIRDVGHYIILTLKGSNPSGAKAAEGKLHK